MSTKRTYQPSKKRRSKFGFMARMASSKGKIIKARRRKGRKVLAVAGRKK